MKSVTLRNMASVTIRRLPGGAVAITGRKLAGGRTNPARSKRIAAMKRRLEQARAVEQRLMVARRKYAYDLFAPGELKSRRALAAASKKVMALDERVQAAIQKEKERVDPRERAFQEGLRRTRRGQVTGEW